MEKKFTFFKSLRFRIMVILVIIGIVPSIIVEIRNGRRKGVCIARRVKIMDPAIIVTGIGI